ncbi:hypothetical protein [Photobacterium aquimaris]|uniref:hypothetical protein n=1 Tax=Photobacterium aquimaris TaxID=512643 RepID=UPI000A988041|nr:hypothetical protein [Photobacterium aquimaris]
MIIKKYLFIAITVFSTLLSVNSNAAEGDIIGHWEDANGNFFSNALGTNDSPRILIDKLVYFLDANTGKIKLDDGQGYYHTYITDADWIWYESSDCSGNGYLSNNDSSYMDGNFKAPPAGVIFESTPDIINKKVLRFEYGKGAVMWNESFHSTGRIQPDGKYKCEKYEFEHEPHSYDQVEVKNEILNPPENIIGNNKYSKLRFSYDNGSFAIYANALLPLKLVEKQIQPEPDPKPRIAYQSPVNSVSIRISSQGKLSYVTVNQGQSLYIGDIKVSKLSTGVYDVTFPESYIAADRARDKLILTCNVNSNNRNQGGEMGISCYKLDDKNIIRIVTEYHKHPINTDFTLGVKW